MPVGCGIYYNRSVQNSVGIRTSKNDIEYPISRL